jgi:hypothetical protein
MAPRKITARASKPVLVVAPTVKDFDAFLAEKNTKRTSSRLPVSAVVGHTEHIMVELNRRVEWIRAKRFSKIVYAGCQEDQAFDWFKSLVNSRVN